MKYSTAFLARDTWPFVVIAAEVRPDLFFVSMSGERLSSLIWRDDAIILPSSILEVDAVPAHLAFINFISGDVLAELANNLLTLFL